MENHVNFITYYYHVDFSFNAHSKDELTIEVFEKMCDAMIKGGHIEAMIEMIEDYRIPGNILTWDRLLAKDELGRSLLWTFVLHRKCDKLKMVFDSTE